MSHQRLSCYLTFAMLLFLLSGITVSCIGKTPPASFYRLSVMQESAAQNKILQPIGIAVGPILLPSELERPQILIRDTENRVFFSEFHRWAGSLEERIANVISANLASLLGTDRISPRMAEKLFPVTHSVHFQISRFDGQLNGPVVLDVTWSIRDVQQAEPIAVRRTVIQERAATSDYEGLVAAQSRAVGELSRQVAQAFRSLIP